MGPRRKPFGLRSFSIPTKPSPPTRPSGTTSWPNGRMGWIPSMLQGETVLPDRTRRAEGRAASTFYVRLVPVSTARRSWIAPERSLREKEGHGGGRCLPAWFRIPFEEREGGATEASTCSGDGCTDRAFSRTGGRGAARVASTFLPVPSVPCSLERWILGRRTNGRSGTTHDRGSREREHAASRSGRSDRYACDLDVSSPRRIVSLHRFLDPCHRAGHVRQVRRREAQPFVLSESDHALDRSSNGEKDDVHPGLIGIVLLSR